MRWPTQAQIQSAILQNRLTILRQVPPGTPFAWIESLHLMMLSGTLFGPGHLGVQEWKDPSYGFCINNAEARAECEHLLQRRPNNLSALVILTEETRKFTNADFGLDALSDPERIVRIGEHYFVPAEVFLSRIYGALIPRLRNPTTVST